MINNCTFKLGSLFDGSGGFPLAATLCGGDPIWASEIEPYPIAVTRNRFPHMQHLGDIRKINGAKIEPVDVITFGSPCQGLSQAGIHKGLSDERSVLFLEAVRIIKEMREATNGRYPTFVLWENVPGAFSSNNGSDFRIVLEELIKIVEPHAVMPPVPKGGWSFSDSYCGDGWSLAYRVFDAQYWGVPQRRRRIHLILDLGGARARKILFEREGVRWYFTKSGATKESITADSKSGSSECSEQKGIIACYDARGNGNGKVAPTLTGDHERRVTDYTAIVYVMQAFGKYLESDKASSLKARDYKDATDLIVNASEIEYIVRRLTPTECARLQGFADWWGCFDRKEDLGDDDFSFWTDVRNTYARALGKPIREYTKKQMLTWYNSLHSDAAEYKMWGNGIALPPALYCMQGVAQELAFEKYIHKN